MKVVQKMNYGNKIMNYLKLRCLDKVLIQNSIGSTVSIDYIWRIKTFSDIKRALKFCISDIYSQEDTEGCVSSTLKSTAYKDVRYFTNQGTQQKLEAESISRATGKEILGTQLCNKPAWGTKTLGARAQAEGCKRTGSKRQQINHRCVWFY